MVLRRAVIRLDETSPHLLSDIGMPSHPLASCYDADTERKLQAVRVSLAGR